MYSWPLDTGEMNYSCSDPFRSLPTYMLVSSGFLYVDPESRCTYEYTFYKFYVQILHKILQKKADNSPNKIAHRKTHRISRHFIWGNNETIPGSLLLPLYNEKQK